MTLRVGLEVTNRPRFGVSEIYLVSMVESESQPTRLAVV